VLFLLNWDSIQLSNTRRFNYIYFDLSNLNFRFKLLFLSNFTVRINNVGFYGRDQLILGGISFEIHFIIFWNIDVCYYGFWISVLSWFISGLVFRSNPNNFGHILFVIFVYFSSISALIMLQTRFVFYYWLGNSSVVLDGIVCWFR